MIRSISLVLLCACLAWLAVGSAWAAPAAPPQEQRAASDGKVNINTASKTELMKLEGVGPSVADKIIEYRKANGPFKKPEDIRKVRGVGKGIWEKIRGSVTVE